MTAASAGSAVLRVLRVLLLLASCAVAWVPSGGFRKQRTRRWGAQSPRMTTPPPAEKAELLGLIAQLEAAGGRRGSSESPVASFQVRPCCACSPYARKHTLVNCAAAAVALPRAAAGRAGGQAGGRLALPGAGQALAHRSARERRLEAAVHAAQQPGPRGPGVAPVPRGERPVPYPAPGDWQRAAGRPRLPATAGLARGPGPLQQLHRLPGQSRRRAQPSGVAKRRPLPARAPQRPPPPCWLAAWLASSPAAGAPFPTRQVTAARCHSMCCLLA